MPDPLKLPFPNWPPQTPTPDPNNIRPDRSDSAIREDSLVAGDVEILPIVYGRAYLEPLTGFIYPFSAYDLTGLFFYCIGGTYGIEGIESVYIINAGNEDIDAWTNGVHGATKTITATNPTYKLTQYHGINTQIVDPTLDLIPGYADKNIYTESNMNIGEVYIVSTQNQSTGKSEIMYPAVIVKGLKCWDPRTSTNIYTTNMALAFADFMDKDYGANLTVDWDSVETLADMNDEEYPLASGRKRFWGGVVFRTPAFIDKHIERFRAISGCMVRMEGSTVYFVPNRPAASVFTFDTSNIVKGSFRSRYKDMTEIPTRVECSYTDTSRIPWAIQTDAVYEHPDVDAGILDRRTTTIRLNDAQSRAVATRYAEQYYREKAYQPWEVEFDSMEMAAKYHQGDVITVTHPYIGTDVLFRIIKNPEKKGERKSNYHILAGEYDAAVYVDSDAADTPISLPSKYDPIVPPPVSIIDARESLIPDKDGRITSRVVVTFEVEDWPYVDHYRIRMKGAGQVFEARVLPEVKGVTLTYLSSDLSRFIENPNGEVFSVIINTVSVIGDIVSTDTKITLTVKGKYNPPPDISGFVLAVFENGVSRLKVSPVEDIGLIGYKFRVNYIDSQGWDGANTIDLHKGIVTIPEFNQNVFDIAVDGKTVIFYYAKAVDNVGLYSVNAAQVKVVIDTEYFNATVMSKELSANDVETTNYMVRDFIYDDAEYYVYDDTTQDMEDRIGISGTWLNYSSKAWYQHHTTPATDPYVKTNYSAITFSAERMAENSMQIETNYFPSASEPSSSIYKKLTVFSTTLGTFTSINEYLVYALEKIKSELTVNSFTTPANDYIELKFPITIKTKRIEYIQEGVEGPLNNAAMPKTITFTTPYLSVPRLQMTFRTSDKNWVIVVTAITNTNFTVDSVGSGGSPSYYVTWAVKGE